MTPRIAIVGCGSIGSRHINNLLAMGYQDLVAVEPRSMPHDERVPIVSMLEDLGSWDLTHALICSPPEFHYRHARYFINRGVRTFIEKPMTMTAMEARTLCAIAHMNKQEIALGYMERAHPTVLAAKQWAKEHGPGMAYFHCYWRAEKKTYRLSVADESSHAVDTALFVMGRADSALRLGGSEVRSHIEVAHGCGRSKIMMDMDTSPLRSIALYAADGSNFTGDYGTTPEEWSACYKAELQAFLDGRPLCTGEDGVKVMEVLEQLR